MQITFDVSSLSDNTGLSESTLLSLLSQFFDQLENADYDADAGNLRVSITNGPAPITPSEAAALLANRTPVPNPVSNLAPGSHYFDQAPAPSVSPSDDSDSKKIVVTAYADWARSTVRGLPPGYSLDLRYMEGIRTKDRPSSLDPTPFADTRFRVKGSGGPFYLRKSFASNTSVDVTA